ncbi:unnamed protein product [Closterium sp. NIES-64]|nr:unnamed protein product [Closterium sp. NIES-64]
MKCPICHDLVDRPVTVRPPSTLPSPSPCDLPPPFPPRHRATSLHPSLPVTVRPPSTLPFPSPCDLPPPFPPRHRATSLHPSLPVTVRPPSTLPSPSPCDLPPPFPPRHRATSLHPSLPVTVRPSSLPSCFHSCARHSFPPPPASLHPFSPRSSILSSCPLNSPFPHLSPPNARQTPCGHNFCLVCFRKWLAQGKRSCAKCRRAVPPDMMKQPRINPVIVAAIRHAKAAAARAAAGGLSTSAPAKPYEPICNEKRPDQAFTTDRAVRKGLSNAASGRIFVTIAGDFFGPITAEYDPERGTGVEVGETWASRLECRQWGAHLPHVAGIAGQSHHGAQSVALSGGYEDDEDNGEWFLYTGSGGRDLSGNKRTNKVHAFDQRFEKSNQALRLSCLKGYPVRVVRSEKERRSSYAPQAGVRYDGVYRIERCWRKKSKVGFLVCRYLFVRCDNSPAPWTSDDVGDSPGRKLPQVAELKQAVDVTERTGPPAWDWIEEKQQWGWVRAPPACTKPIGGTSTAWRSAKRLAVGSTGEAVKKRRALAQKRLAKDFACLLCGGVLRAPVSTPCQHSFCLACLQQRFHGQADTRDRSKTAGRSLRAQKIVKQCPAARCTADIADVLSRLQVRVGGKVNHDMADLIAMLLAETNAPDAEEGEDAGEGGEEDGEEGAEGEEDEEDENNAEDEEKDSKGQAEGKEREGNIEGAGEEGVKEEGRSKGVQALDAIGAAGSTGGAGEGKGKGAQAEVDGGREGGVDGGKTGGVVGALSPTSGGVAGVTTASAPADAAAQGAAAKGMAAVGTAVERAETERAAAGKAQRCETCWCEGGGERRAQNDGRAGGSVLWCVGLLVDGVAGGWGCWWMGLLVDGVAGGWGCWWMILEVQALQREVVLDECRYLCAPHPPYCCALVIPSSPRLFHSVPCAKHTLPTLPPLFLILSPLLALAPLPPLKPIPPAIPFSPPPSPSPPTPTLLPPPTPCAPLTGGRGGRRRGGAARHAEAHALPPAAGGRCRSDDDVVEC